MIYPFAHTHTHTYTSNLACLPHDHPPSRTCLGGDEDSAWKKRCGHGHPLLASLKLGALFCPPRNRQADSPLNIGVWIHSTDYRLGQTENGGKAWAKTFESTNKNMLDASVRDIRRKADRIQVVSALAIQLDMLLNSKGPNLVSSMQFSLIYGCKSPRFLWGDVLRKHEEKSKVARAENPCFPQLSAQKPNVASVAAKVWDWAGNKTP